MFGPKFLRLVLPVLLCASAPAVFGQQGRTPGRSVLPRVGMIDRDGPTSSRLAGCDSHLLSFRAERDELFFESHPDGLDAWMNLGGRNVRLRLLKTTLTYLDEYGTASGVYEYSHKGIAVTVRLPVVNDYIDWVPAKLVVRKGRAARTIKAFVMPQCDAL